MIIHDPKTGDAAPVDAVKGLKTASTSTPELWEALRTGKAFYCSTGVQDIFGGNSTGTSAGTYYSTERIVAELYNNTNGDLLLTGCEVSNGRPHTLGPYAPLVDGVDDIEVRINQWLYQGQLLGTAGSDGIVNNLNRTSTAELESRPNGNKAMRWCTLAAAVATPGIADPGYICGFRMSHNNRPKSALPADQPIIIGRGQSWLLSLVPMQNSAPTNMVLSVRCSVIKL